LYCRPRGRLVVLESGLGLESGLESVFAGLGLGLGLESYGLGLGLGLGLESYGLGLGLGLGLGFGLGGSASKSFFKSDEFEQAFGKNNGIPAAVCTRWNSTLRQLQAVVALEQKKLTTVLEARGYKNIILTSREWAQLSEL